MNRSAYHIDLLSRQVYLSKSSFALLIGFTITLISSILFQSPTSQSLRSPANSLPSIHSNADLYNLPLSFIPNVGQTDEQVMYESRGLGGHIFFTADDIVLSLPDNAKNNPSVSSHKTVRLVFENAQSNPQITGVQQLPGTVSYMRGNEPSDWQTNLPTYEGVTYADIYPGIDVYYEGTDGNLKSTYVVQQGVNPQQIQWSYQGASNVHLNRQTGNLHITIGNGTSAQTLIEHAPIAWQDIGNQRFAVPVYYNVTADQSIHFILGAYNPSYPLIIDPTLEYSTFLGGDNFDAINDIAIDADGNTYVVGTTTSSTFPGNTPGTTFGTSLARPDVFVTKINPDGTQILFSSIIGGAGTDEGNSIAVDGGSVYIAGQTYSTAFPTNGGQTAFDTTYNGSSDGFTLALDTATGATLEYSTYLGGAESDVAYGVAASGNNIFVTGSAEPSSFAEPPASSGGRDAFVIKLDRTAGSTEAYSRRIGGLANDDGNAIAIDGAGNAYVIGRTNSTDATFPTAGTPFQATKATGSDIFIAQLDSTGTPTYISYLGGNGDDVGLDIAVPSAGGRAYLTGYTLSSDFPGASGYSGTQDAFIVNYDLATPGIDYSHYLGGANTDQGNAITIDSDGNAFVTGWTNSSDFPAISAFQNYAGGQDAFVARLTATGDTVYSTFLGGSGPEYGTGIATGIIGGRTKVHVAGYTTSSDYPTAGTPLQATKSSGFDGFIARIDNITPVVDLNGTPADINFTTTFVEDSGSIPIVNSTGLTITDTDNIELSYAEIRITNILDAGQEGIEVTPSGSITAGDITEPITGTIRIQGPAPLSDFEAVLRSTVYNNTSESPNQSPRFIEFEVSDGLDSNDPFAVATVLIESVNDAPVLTIPGAQTVTEDIAQTISGVSVSDTDAGSGSIQVTVSATNGTLSAAAAGSANVSGNNSAALTITGTITDVNSTLTSLEYTGNTDFNGADTITVEADDQGNTPSPAKTDTKTIAVTVDASNDPPATTNDTANVNEDDSVTIGVLANDNDNKDTAFGGADLLPVAPGALTITSGPANGTPTINPDGTITYTPDPDYSGADSFTYQICDNGTPNPAACATANVDVTVAAINDPPTFTSGGNVTVAEDSGAYGPTTWATTISPGPADEAGQTVTFNIVNNSNAALFSTQPAIAANGDLTFTPATDAYGEATITLQAQDDGGTADGGQDTSPSENFTITITPDNDAPVAVNDTFDVNEDSPLNLLVLDNDNDTKDTAFGSGGLDLTSITIATGPSNGTALPQPDGTVRYTPNADFSGSDSFTYHVDDTGHPTPAEQSNTATVTINVLANNDPPTFTPGGNVTVAEDSGAYGPTAWATAITSGSGESGQTISFIVDSDDTGLFDTQPAIAANGDLTFTPATDAYGEAIITVRAQDDGGTANGGQDTSNPQTFTITITPINDPPVAVDDTLSVNEDNPTNLDVLGNDDDDKDEDFGNGGLDLSSVTIVAAPTNGSAIPQPDGTVRYTPDTDYNGPDSFTYHVSDTGHPTPAQQSNTATVDINVQAVNDPPTFTSGGDVTVDEDSGTYGPTPWATDIATGPADE
ncbi:MAG: Ig-like domain-containing protein, partial [Chloroflexota bacterium]